MEMHYNNCPSQKAAHPACEWEEMYPVCESKIDLTSQIIKARAYYNGRGNTKRIGGMVLRLDDGQVHTLGVPKGRYTDWESDNMRLTGLEYDHLDRPVGFSYL